MTGAGKKDGHDMSGNQGEGNRGAAKAYNEETTRFAQSGKAPAKAEEARKALEGAEGDELRRAEEEAKRHSKGEDPALRK
ncbi:MAG: hypothetical protein JWN93_799 [Hyphomicrobiales bacterium]|jgi:predicted ribosome quality control (RQC) complex YloA/Tae2 family protein|nr:hypothetical protein [Hyphomicrobiales bacterium]